MQRIVGKGVCGGREGAAHRQRLGGSWAEKLAGQGVKAALQLGAWSGQGETAREAKVDA